jgi:hypothetical protein
MDTLRYPVPAVGASGHAGRRRSPQAAGSLPALGAARCICGPHELPEVGCVGMTAAGTCGGDPGPARLQALGGGPRCRTTAVAGEASQHVWSWTRDRTAAVTRSAVAAAGRGGTARSAA